MEYKIVFCDIDGTITTSEHTTSPATREKVRQLTEKSIPFVLVSARPPLGINLILKELEIKAPIVCYSGGLVLDENFEEIKSVGMTVEQALEVKEYMKNNWPEITPTAYSFDYWIVDDKNDKWVKFESNITKTTPVEGKITDFVKPDKKVHKFLCMGDAEYISKAEKDMIKKFPHLSCYRSRDVFLEVMSGTATKAQAVNLLCDKYGINIENSVSFGDNFNDINMLQATGISFAMGNAPDAVKEKATYITLDNDNDGVVAGLEKIGL